MATTDDRGGAIDTTRLDTADGDHERPRRVRRVLVGTAIVAVLVSGGAVAVAARPDGSTTRVRTTSPSTVPAAPVVLKGRTKATVPRAKPAPTVAVTTVPSTTPQTLVAVPPPASGPARTIAPPPPPPAPPPPAPTTAAPPKQYGASALTWDAPPSLAITAGKTATLTVTAHNPTDGTVTLPHPLACTPRLDHGEICTEMVQLIGSGKSASARYTIDASGTAKGHYTLKIEGVLTVSVTVT
ncbi:MAG: hypothetical protein QOH28_815 [Actinomycetota bacterium]|nr:hypothetical protein [Actinomycetota bacterium]